MSYKICTKCKKRKILEEEFYKIRKGRYYLSECKECFKNRTHNDYTKRGLAHNYKVKKNWFDKQGGNEYHRKVFKKYYDNNSEIVKKRVSFYYHKTKKYCKICNKIKPNHMFKESSAICTTCQTDYNYEYDFLGSCGHKIHGSSNSDIPLEHQQEDWCPFCSQKIIIKIIKKRKVLKDRIFKEICKKQFPEYIKVNNISYCFVVHQIMGHRTCRMYYYNGHLNKTLIESFIQDPDDCIKDFTEKFKKLVYEKINEKDFLQDIYLDDSQLPGHKGRGILA